MDIGKENQLLIGLIFSAVILYITFRIPFYSNDQLIEYSILVFYLIIIFIIILVVSALFKILKNVQFRKLKVFPHNKLNTHAVNSFSNEIKPMSKSNDISEIDEIDIFRFQLEKYGCRFCNGFILYPKLTAFPESSLSNKVNLRGFSAVNPGIKAINRIDNKSKFNEIVNMLNELNEDQSKLLCISFQSIGGESKISRDYRNFKSQIQDLDKINNIAKQKKISYNPMGNFSKCSNFNLSVLRDSHNYLTYILIGKMIGLLEDTFSDVGIYKHKDKIKYVRQDRIHFNIDNSNNLGVTLEYNGQPIITFYPHSNSISAIVRKKNIRLSKYFGALKSKAYSINGVKLKGVYDFKALDFTMFKMNLERAMDDWKNIIS